MNRIRSIQDVPREWNDLTESIIGAAIEVHSILGPGLLERLYETALAHELRRRGLDVLQQVSVRLAYKDIALGDQVLDLVVGGLVVVELKSIESVHEVHLRQLVSYMKSGGYPLGLLMNFNVPQLRRGIHRRVLTKWMPPAAPHLSDPIPTLPPRFSASVSAHSAITPVST